MDSRMELMLNEVTSGDYITGDHMERFGHILETNTPYRPVSTYLIATSERVQPVETPHIQVLFSGRQIFVDDIGHWIVAYHDGSTLRVYDSLNTGTLTPDQVTFLSKLFPHLSIVPTFVPVQAQENFIDCGVFAIANATSLALGRDPSKERYVLDQMRPHLASLLLSGRLQPFLSQPLSPDPDQIEMDSLHKTPSTSLSVIRESYPPLPPPRRSGRPLKKRIGRPKNSEISRDEQRRTAKKRYADTHPEVNISAVKKYTSVHPEVNRKAVEKYTSSHPEVNQKAVKKYTSSHPEVNQKAVKKYTSSHPEVNQKAVKKYTSSHPEVHQKALETYTKTNKDGLAKTKKTQRAIPKNLRKRSPIGLLPDKYLQEVHPYNLKQTNLMSPGAYKCPHCGAALFDEEKGREMWCCGKGAYHNNILPPVDASFYESEQFLKDARSYNNLFSFSAIGVSGGFQKHKTGISFVKILGRTYHRVFDLSWQGSHNNCGMYIDDGEERLRLAAGRSLDSNITSEIKSYLSQVNPFIPQLRRLSLETSEHAHIVFQQTSRRTHGPVLGDVPYANEISAVINTNSSSYTSREVVIWKIGEKKPHTVNMFHPSYECLQYPLLFPHGSEGWHIGMLDSNGKKTTQVKYYRHLLLSQPRFSKFRRLSQEYFVDMFCRTEEERLKFIANNQGSVLRIATREEIDETIAGEGGVQVGRIYLPSSFTNSSRYMQVKYQDGMAIVHRLGKPTYFLTVTCNPKWKEIQESLNQGEHPKDRPDLCNRVFQLKLNFLIKEIKSGKVFGHLVYILHVIEFQKRGLPHAHICFRVQGGPNEGNEIDAVIRASIPPDNEERLRGLVLEHMVHGPACTKRSDLPCVDPKTKKCTKDYPKPQVETTHVDDRGFVQYKRSATNIANIKKGKKHYTVSDLDIVPYNAVLLLQMECHINLELASTRKIVKYLFKYIHKGPDAVRVGIVSDRQQGLDEIEEYVTRRYIGASDAIWRLLEFDVTGRYPSVIQLPIHLPNKDHVVYRPGEEEQALQHAKSKLIIYMERPKTKELANTNYCDFFENYIIDSKPKSLEAFKIDKYFVTRRKRGQIVARIYWVSPALGELYYLRMMLQRFPCFSFEDIRTIEGTTYPTFQEAARAVGLLNEEKEFSEALSDAAVFMTGPNLRRCFFILITNGAPAVTLWEKNKDLLCEDLLLMFPDDPELAYVHGLRDIDRVLRNQGSSLVDMGLPQVPDDTTEVSREMFIWSSSNCSSFVESWLPKLNKDQVHVYRQVIDVWETNAKQKVLFIDGAGGTGKTLLLNVITAHFRSRGLIVLCTATTGVAALLHDGGVTAHSKFKLPLDTSDTLAFWSVSGNSQRAELIRQSALIIWDEAPMAHKSLVDVLDRSLQNLMNSREHFGGKIVLFSGDFRQIPPVVPTGAPIDAVNVSLKRSTHWSRMIKIKLNTLQRTKDDISFSAFIQSVGDGSIEETILDGNKVIALQHIHYVNDMDSLIDFVYPPDVVTCPDECCGRAILSGTNANIREINSIILDLIPGDAVELLSADTCVSESNDDEVIHTELLNTISQPRVPDHRLALKVGAVCILMRNLCFDQKLVNGTKLIVTAISRFCISARQPHSKETIMIPRISFKFSVGTAGMEIIRRQFPLQLAYGLTINKSQGQTLNTVGVDLRSDVFAHGQLYVALSRVRNSASLKVLVPPERVVDGVAHCANVVYKKLIE